MDLTPARILHPAISHSRICSSACRIATKRCRSVAVRKLRPIYHVNCEHTHTLAPAVVALHCLIMRPLSTRICLYSPCCSCCATLSDAAASFLSSIFRSTCQFTLLVASTSRHTFRMYVKRRSVAAFRENMQYDHAPAHVTLHHVVWN